MNPVAIEQATLRLAKATEAVERLKAARSFRETSQAWTDFLIAASTIYSKLEQGSKDYGRSSAWFGRVKRLRKVDPLLSYIHHARNSDEHGIDEVLSMGNRLRTSFGEFTINVPAEMILIQETNKSGKITRREVSGEAVVALYSVRDNRYNDEFHPPTEHLGQPLNEFMSPVNVAELALDYIGSLLEEAKTYLVS
jgi:hypothetical protein